MVLARRWVVALLVLALIWLTALMVKSDLSDSGISQAATDQPLGALSYLAAEILAWWVLSFILGIIVGWSTWVFAPERFGDGIVALVWIAFLLLLVVAVADVTPVRVDFWLEAALLMFFVYWLGCGLGWAFRCIAAMHRHEALAARADTRTREARLAPTLTVAARSSVETAAASPTSFLPAAPTVPESYAEATTPHDKAVQPMESTAPAATNDSEVRTREVSTAPPQAAEKAAALSVPSLNAPDPIEGAPAAVASSSKRTVEVASPVGTDARSQGPTQAGAPEANPDPNLALESRSDVVARAAEATDDVAHQERTTDEAAEVPVDRAVPADPVPIEALVPATPGSPVAAPAPNSNKHPGNQPQGLVAPRADKADDLKLIRGIGPQNEGRLNGLGIWHFDQIAAWTPDNVLWAGSYLAFPGRIQREQWVAQAAELAAGRGVPVSKRAPGGKAPRSSQTQSPSQRDVTKS